MILLANISKFERQRDFYSGRKCPYCLQETELVDSQVVHQKSHGMIYLCSPCRAWVGTRYGDQALGFVAKEPLRRKRREALDIFMVLCRAKSDAFLIPENQAIKQGMKWISTLLDISSDLTHFAFFDTDDCDKIITECHKYLSGKSHNDYSEVSSNIEALASSYDIRVEKKLKSLLSVKFPDKELLIDLKRLKNKWVGTDKWFSVKDYGRLFNKNSST